MTRTIESWMISCFILLIAGPPAALAQTNRPNVLFIAVDDLNDRVGPLGGHPQVKTPNLDRLARAGTVFSNAHCQAPLCNPSRTSVLTGLRPSTTGIYALEPWFRTVPSLRNVVTLPQYFAAHGYRTLTTGKIYHDGLPPGNDRTKSTEFNVWGYAGSHGPLPAKKLVNTPSPMRLVDWGVYPQRDEKQDDFKVTDWALEQLKSLPADGSWMLCVGLRKPHVPCFATQRWFDLYPLDGLIMPPVKADDRDDVPRSAWYLHWRLPEPRLAWLREHDQWENLVRSYLACVSFMDSQVGRLLDGLQAGGQAERTVVVLWGDHGFHLGEKGMMGKTTLWERSTRVPLLWAGPGIAPRAKCTRPAELLDIYPTLVELCGLPPKPELEGHSLARQLKDAGVPRRSPAVTTHGPENHAVRGERYRYIRYADGAEELYDNTADPNEWTNLAGNPAHAAAKAELARWLPKRNAPPAPGSKSRLIEWREGTPIWEEVPIDPASQPE